MRIDAKTPLALAARELLQQRAETFFDLLEEAPLSFDAEAIHDLRVASRRLRAGLQLFSPCYPAKSVRRLRREVRVLTRELGELRNIDEALLFFDRTASELEGPGRELAAALAGDFRHRQEEEQARLRPWLHLIHSGSLKKHLRKTISRPYLLTTPPPDPDPFIPLSDFARDALTCTLVPVLELLPQARREAETEAQHRLRIAVKKYRYRVELLAPVLGESFGEVHKALKDYQEVLGKMHDLDVFAAEAAEAQTDSGLPSLLERIGVLRRERFRHFEELLASAPFERIGARIGEAL